MVESLSRRTCRAGECVSCGHARRCPGAGACCRDAFSAVGESDRETFSRSRRSRESENRARRAGRCLVQHQSGSRGPHCGTGARGATCQVPGCRASLTVARSSAIGERGSSHCAGAVRRLSRVDAMAVGADALVMAWRDLECGGGTGLCTVLWSVDRSCRPGCWCLRIHSPVARQAVAGAGRLGRQRRCRAWMIVGQASQMITS